MLLQQLVDAHVTLIGVTTDDPANAGETLKSLLGQDVAEYKPNSTKEKVQFSFKYEPTNQDVQRLSISKHTVILVNYTGDYPSVFDAGELPTPIELLKSTVLASYDADEQKEIIEAVNGLSYRKAQQLVRIAKIRELEIAMPTLRNLRFELYGMDEGLYPMPKLDEVYAWDEHLRAWADANLPYLKAPVSVLTPRGLLLHGTAGTGKTMAVKALAKEVNIPAYRLDIGASLSKWSGESEARIRKHLAFIEQESPCILLIDEVEKVIKTSDEDTVSTRILAQLLWWLAEHRSRVLTIMTSNDITVLPKELYREGRCDAVFLIDELTVDKAQDFAREWVNIFAKKHGIKLDMKKANQLSEHITKNMSGKEKYSPAHAVEVAKQAIKRLKLLL